MHREKEPWKELTEAVLVDIIKYQIKDGWGYIENLKAGEFTPNLGELFCNLFDDTALNEYFEENRIMFSTEIDTALKKISVLSDDIDTDMDKLEETLSSVTWKEMKQLAQDVLEKIAVYNQEQGYV